MARFLNNGLEALDKVADSRMVAIVIGTTNMVANTGAAPIPNCLGPIVDGLDKLLKTIQASKALQKSCSGLINTCCELQEILQTHRKTLELTDLGNTLSNTIGVLEDAQETLVRYVMMNRLQALMSRTKMKKDVEHQESKVKDELQIYKLRSGQEILSGVEGIHKMVRVQGTQLGAVPVNVQETMQQAPSTASEVITESQPSDKPGSDYYVLPLHALDRPIPDYIPPGYPSETLRAVTASTTTMHEDGIRKRYPIEELPRERFGPALMTLGSNRLEYWVASRKLDSQQVLIRLPRDSIEEHEIWGMKGIKNELEIWSHLQHPHVVPLLGVMEFRLPQNGFHLGLVSPFYKNRNVVDYVTTNPGVNRFQLYADFALGMEYLHSQRVAHGDVRGSSVLINDQGQAVMSDFHMSRFVDIKITYDPDSTEEFEAELHWRAPELMVDYHPPTLESDIYSFASTLYEIGTGKKPMHADGMRTEVRAMMATLNDGLHPKRPPRNVWFPEDVWALMERCWNHNPEERPKIEECVVVLRKANERYLSEQSQKSSQAAE